MPYIVSRLFFSDDNLLFCNATNQECQKLIEILELLPQGQKINTNKSSIFFSNNTSHEKRSEMDILGQMQDSQQSKYLGLPFIIGNSKTEFFFWSIRNGGEEIGKLEGKIDVYWRERDSHKSNGSNDSNVYFKLVLAP